MNLPLQLIVPRMHEVQHVRPRLTEGEGAASSNQNKKAILCVDMLTTFRTVA